MLVDVVRDHEVHALVSCDKRTELAEQHLERIGIHPVIGIDVLEVDAVGIGEGLHGGNVRYRHPSSPQGNRYW